MVKIQKRSLRVGSRTIVIFRAQGDQVLVKGRNAPQ
jgi:hypothetical protein